ncbi:MAG TPA: DNA repair protein RecO [Candidatus Brocadiia bacterium]|nr:DNA repair protein RecO [Planctomycetota bacterium]MDO8093577.1 DNA repair protein RecO [Candidatus Brocadiales bacterium]
MALCKTLAITLKRSDYSDTSQIVSFYTLDYGRIHVLAKGSKRYKKKFTSVLDLLTYNEIVFIKRDITRLYTLTEWELIDNFPGLRENLDKFYLASYVAELVGEFTEENDRNEKLFELLLNALRGISLSAGIPAMSVYLLTFEMQMLKLAGYLPEMIRCVNCENELQLKRYVSFSASKGGVLCEKCQNQSQERIAVLPGAITAASYLANCDFQRVARLRIQPSLYADIRRMLKYYISFILNKELRMWKYIS